MKILLTGGAGFIGSHTLIELLAAGHEVVAADNFSNSSPEVFNRLRHITGRPVQAEKVDFCDFTAADALFSENRFDAVVHFAGFKAVGESVTKPLDYYKNNLTATMHVLAAMLRHKVPRIVFSSTAALYGQPDSVPVPETAPLRPTNPYSQSKAMCEQILRDAAAADSRLRVTVLRYFNPVGAHPSGLIGEDPAGIPNNLMPFIAQVAVGRHPYLKVFGDDYDTPDGTGVRDYIHVTDLAKGHAAALQRPARPGQVEVYNLGTGGGYSVLEVIGAFEQACGREIPYRIVERRPGDVDYNYADSTKAATSLDWHATQTISDMCRDAWNWQSKNPNGYRDKINNPE